MVGSRTLPVLNNGDEEPDTPKWIQCKGCNGVMKIHTKILTQKGIFQVRYYCKKCKSFLRRTYFKSAD